MKILKILGAIIGIILLAVVVLSLTGPDKLYVERSIDIEASPAQVYSELISFENFNEWSPWYEKDPAAKYTFDGPESGVGATFSWKSDTTDVGNGSMTIEEVKENEMILYSMTFDQPGEPYARYIIKETDGGTNLTWTFEQENLDFISSAMFAVMSIEDFLAPDYDKGLKNFKKYIESKPAMESDTEISTVETEPISYLGLEGSVSPNTSENISAKMGEMYGQIMGHMESAKIEMKGMPLAVFTSMDEDKMDMICGIPVEDGTTSDHESIKAMTIEGGTAVRAIHKGDYNLLTQTHEAINGYMASNNLELGGNPYEIYVTDPGEVKDTTQWVTHVFYPVKQ